MMILRILKNVVFFFFCRVSEKSGLKFSTLVKEFVREGNLWTRLGTPFCTFFFLEHLYQFFISVGIPYNSGIFKG